MKANKFAAGLTSAIANCTVDSLHATILCQMSAGYISAADLGEQLNLGPHKISAQLLLMRKAGLIDKLATRGHYAIAQGGKDILRELFDFIHRA